jgi:deoxyribodipyrimidine photo-lyase
MSRVVWVHPYMLNPAYLDSPAIFVFDEAQINRDGWTLKRIQFLYECLLDLPVEIHRGGVVEAVRQFAARHGAEEVVSVRDPDPHVTRQGDLLGVKWVEPLQFVSIPARTDLKRFSRYWRAAEPALLGGR